LWFRLAKAGARFACHHKVLAHHRIVESSLSGDTISQLQRTLTVIETIGERKDLSANEKAALDRAMCRTQAQLAIEKGKEELLVKDFEAAAKYFDQAIGLQHNWKLMAVRFALKIAPGMVWRLYQRRMAGTGNSTI
jgi:hypothetical protein